MPTSGTKRGDKNKDKISGRLRKLYPGDTGIIFSVIDPVIR